MNKILNDIFFLVGKKQLISFCLFLFLLFVTKKKEVLLNVERGSDIRTISLSYGVEPGFHNFLVTHEIESVKAGALIIKSNTGCTWNQAMAMSIKEHTEDDVWKHLYELYETTY